MPINLAFMASGRGSNLQAILSAIKAGQVDAKPLLVISNDAKAAALDVAREFSVEAKAIPSAGISRSEHEARVHEELALYRIDYLILAGYMRILTKEFLRPFKDPRGFYRIINIHPSLLPAFPGKNAYEDAFNYGVKLSGITIHFVDEEVDHGPILAQESFPRLDDDTLESFKKRGLSVEHKLYPAVLQMLAQGRIPISLQEPVQT
jgi:phosphoribosylglycinamide formyltransferase 1